MGAHLKAGLKWAMEISRLGNQYLQEAEPWTVLKSDPQNTKALYRRAFCYDKLKDVEKCSKDLEAVMKLIPDDPSVKNLAARNQAAKKAVNERRRAMAQKMFGGL